MVLMKQKVESILRLKMNEMEPSGKTKGFLEVIATAKIKKKENQNSSI
jgi:hypothetical protein